MISSPVSIVDKTNVQFDAQDCAGKRVDFLSVRNSQIKLNSCISRCYFYECFNITVDISNAPPAGVYFENCALIRVRATDNVLKSTTLDFTRCRDVHVDCKRKVKDIVFKLHEHDCKQVKINDDVLPSYEYSVWEL